MPEILLTRGLVTLVDDEDFDRLSASKWSALVTRDGHRYAVRSEGERFIFMHRAIIAAPPGKQVDHHDGDGLNNRRGNLRLATNRQNQQNRRSRDPSKTSRFKGVSFAGWCGRWRAQITVAGSNRHVGYFSNEVEAALAYDEEARVSFGCFAALNFPHKE